MAQSNSKKGKRRRVAKTKISAYWTERHPANMLRRALRIFNGQGHDAAMRFVKLHEAHCKPCEIILDARYRKAVG